jgi:spore coat polysaccharide biosynthesis protein SpsF
MNSQIFDLTGKTTIILQARMNSNRLPGKVMKLIGGVPMIGILIERLKKACLPILLATSQDKENDALVDYIKTLGISVFRGSESNVLERYYQAAKETEAKTIIRVTGDNPLIDGNFLRDSIEKYWTPENERAYLSSALSCTYPLGTSFEVFSFNLLTEANNKAILPGEFEHVTPYMHQNIPGNIQLISFYRNESKYNYRLTVDTYEDFILIKKLIEEFGCDKLSMEQIITVIDNNPQLQSMNIGVQQKRWDS